MVYFPIRKCYQAVKISMLVILVVAVLTLFEQWRGGNRNAGATYSDPLVAEYERQILEDEARIIPGLGEGGVAAHLMGEEKKLGEESEKKLAINVYLSDRIPYNRTLKDFRNPACQRVVYDAELPSASVIIIFHNEPYSVVVRTLWSVVNSAKRSNPWFKHANFVDQQTGRVTNLGYPGQDPNSPYVYLKEIILVDDNSTLPELKGKLSHYIRTRLPPNLIRILRLPDREGLMRARIRGARSARGEVLIFLDAHCEGQRDWLRPLLQRVRHKRDTAITPIIDVIDQTTFELQASESFQVGGFTFMGHFTWTEVPDREKKRRGSDIAPTWSPTMAGGLFAINRDYFWELGAYDEQMAGWGGENLEMSFRIWQCGGTLETIPCSRVGHVFRAFHPYGLPASSDTHGINTARMAEVWMDEYAELFYLHRPDLRNNPRIGDVTHRRVLRDKLRCKSFQWYLDNVYRDKFVPVRDVYGYGRFKNPATQLCLDTLQREGDKVALGAYPCYPALQATQYFSLSNRGEIRDETDCASVQPKRVNPEDDKELTRAVVMSTCHGKGRDQKWVRLPSGQLRHAVTSLCLTAPRTVSDVTATVCDPSLTTQIWHIDYNEDNDFRLDSNEVGAMSEEQYNRISKLRGQRSNRISRSLLSYPDNVLDDTALIDNATVRRHTHKSKHHKRHGHKAKHSIKKRVKNKFILKLVRTLMNGTDDHLEVDIHCKHKQLYPNNTFVRDLVTILNDKNIKVINNGRVFERNKVSEIRAANKVLNKMDIEGPAQPPTQPLQPAPPSLPQVFSPAAKPHKKPKVPPEMSAMNPKRVAHPKGSGFADVEDVPSRASNHVIGGEGGVDKKLVIEDFVEVNDEHTTEVDKMFVERHKHKRKPRPHAQTSPRHAHATAPQNPATDSSEPLRNDGDSDGLDAPLMDDTLDRSEPREDGPVGAARLRHERLKAGEGSRSGYPPVVGDLLPDISELQRAMRAEDTENRARGRHDTRHGGRHDDFRDTDLEQAPIDTDVHFNKNELTAFEPRYSRSQTSTSTSANTNANIEGTESEEGPVKLVMRSNVTLHLGLGDEILNWRNKATEDIVNEFINELSIPSNYSAYTEGERYTTGDTASTPADIDTTHAHTQRRTRTHRGDVTSDHSSSSSESSGE